MERDVHSGDILTGVVEFPLDGCGIGIPGRIIVPASDADDLLCFRIDDLEIRYRLVA